MIQPPERGSRSPLSTVRHASPAASECGVGPTIEIKVGVVTRQVRLAEIRLIEACENYTVVILAAGDRLTVRRTMQGWTALLPAGQFARVHRGLIANLDGVSRVERAAAGATRLHFITHAPPLEVKRRQWPALRTRLEARRAVFQVPPMRAVAVLPFASLDRNAANEVFCDGITEELLNVLASVPGLRVVARTSAFYFKGKNLPIPEIARQLGVEFVVEGSVRQTGRRVRITAQLIDAATGFHLWSDRFDQELTDIFAVQDKIAGLIATALRLELEHSTRQAPPIHPEAHRLVLEGRHFWNQRTHDAFLRAESAFTQALALDPTFAPACAGLANVCVVRAMYRLADGVASAEDDLNRARAEALRALALDPSLGEPRAALAFAAFHEGRLADAAHEFPRAFARNPNYATGHQFHAWVLCALGRMGPALAVYDQAIALDPLSFINLDRYGAMLFLARNFSAALVANERAAALRPDVIVGNLAQRAPILWALGRQDQAVAAARAVRRIGYDAPFRRTSDAKAVFVLRQSGFSAEASEYASEVVARLSDDNYVRGFVLGACGRFADAWPFLERTPSIMLPQLYWSPIWDAVRDDAKFHRLIARLGRTEEYQLARAWRS